MSSVFDPVQTIAVTIWALDRGAMAAAAVVAAATVGRAVGHLAAGPLVDARDTGQVMRIALAARLLLTIALVGVINADGLGLATALLLASGFAAGVNGTAYRAAVPALVSGPARARANGLVELAAQLCGVLGTALGGLLFVTAGPSTAVLVNAVSFAPALLTVPRRMHPGRPSRQTRWITEIGAGMRYVADRHWLILLVGFDAVMDAATAGVLAIGLPAHAVAEGAPGAVGLLLAGFAGGSAIGAWARARRTRATSASPMGVFVSNIAQAPLIAVIPWTTPQGAAAALAIAGILNGYATVIYMTCLQDRVDSDYYGRVASLLLVSSLAVQPLAQAVVGLLVDHGWLRGVFALSGTVMLLVSGAMLLVFPAAWSRGKVSVPHPGQEPLARTQGVSSADHPDREGSGPTAGPALG